METAYRGCQSDGYAKCLLHKCRHLGQGYSQASLESRYLEPEVMSLVSVLAP